MGRILVLNSYVDTPPFQNPVSAPEYTHTESGSNRGNIIRVVPRTIGGGDAMGMHPLF